MTTHSRASRTTRERAKAERADALVEAAARLFAQHGFDGVSLEELGSAVGVSGPPSTVTSTASARSSAPSSCEPAPICSPADVA
jgi:hypothetical protein